MRLSLFTDYSLRVLMYTAAHPDRLVTTKEVGKYYDISYNHLVKVVHKLSQEGLIQIRKGNGGGFHLALPAQDIIIGQVVRAVEPDFHLMGCFDCSSNGGCSISSFCLLKKELKQALQNFMDHLDQVRLSEMVRDRKQFVNLKVS